MNAIPAIRLVGKTMQTESVIFDDLIPALPSGMFLVYDITRHFDKTDTTTSVKPLDFFISTHKFPRESRIVSYLKGHNLEAYKAIEYYD